MAVYSLMPVACGLWDIGRQGWSVLGSLAWADAISVCWELNHRNAVEQKHKAEAPSRPMELKAHTDSLQTAEGPATADLSENAAPPNAEKSRQNTGHTAPGPGLGAADHAGSRSS